MPLHSPAVRARSALIFTLPVLVASVVRAGPQTEIARRLGGIMAPVADRGFVGLFVASLTRGDTLCSIHADRPFLPASTQKIETSLAGLSVLGPNRRFL